MCVIKPHSSVTPSHTSHRFGRIQFRNFMATSNPRKHACERDKHLNTACVKFYIYIRVRVRERDTQTLTALAGNALSMTALKPLYSEATPSSLTSSLRTSRNPLGYFPSGATHRKHTHRNLEERTASTDLSQRQKLTCQRSANLKPQPFYMSESIPIMIRISGSQRITAHSP